MDLGLAKKVALVTGGGTGVGRAIAEQFAAEGVRVAIIGKSPEEVNDAAAAIAKAGGAARGRAIDIRDRAEVRRFAAEIAGLWGPIQILVNNAAIHPPPQRFTDLQDKDWQETLDVNLLGARNCTLAVVNGMKAAKWGRLVTVGSMLSETGGPQQAALAAAKAGLVGLTRTLAVELARFGVTANLLLPGLVETRRARTAMGAETWKATVSGIPLRRAARPEEVAAAALFLASESAGYITGALLPVAGGAGLASV